MGTLPNREGFLGTDLDRRRGLGGDLRALIFWEETQKVLTRGKVPWISASLRLLDARGHAKWKRRSKTAFTATPPSDGHFRSSERLLLGVSTTVA